MTTRPQETMPEEREGLTHKVHIEGIVGYITANRREDGSLREVFIHGFGALGSTNQGWTDTFGVLVSLALQADWALSDLAKRFAHVRFDPCGYTDNPEIPHCQSIPDYVFKWLALRFGSAELQDELRLIDNEMPHR
jgi:ribonucleoside-diphosphate reductase alpha chain